MTENEKVSLFTNSNDDIRTYICMRCENTFKANSHQLFCNTCVSGSEESEPNS